MRFNEALQECFDFAIWPLVPSCHGSKLHRVGQFFGKEAPELGVASDTGNQVISQKTKIPSGLYQKRQRFFVLYACRTFQPKHVAYAHVW